MKCTRGIIFVLITTFCNSTLTLEYSVLNAVQKSNKWTLICNREGEKWRLSAHDEKFCSTTRPQEVLLSLPNLLSVDKSLCIAGNYVKRNGSLLELNLKNENSLIVAHRNFRNDRSTFQFLVRNVTPNSKLYLKLESGFSADPLWYISKEIHNCSNDVRYTLSCKLVKIKKRPELEVKWKLRDVKMKYRKAKFNEVQTLANDGSGESVMSYDDKTSYKVRVHFSEANFSDWFIIEKNFKGKAASVNLCQQSLATFLAEKNSASTKTTRRTTTTTTTLSTTAAITIGSTTTKGTTSTTKGTTTTTKGTTTTTSTVTATTTTSPTTTTSTHTESIITTKRASPTSTDRTAYSVTSNIYKDIQTTQEGEVTITQENFNGIEKINISNVETNTTEDGYDEQTGISTKYSTVIIIASASAGTVFIAVVILASVCRTNTRRANKINNFVLNEDLQIDNRLQGRIQNLPICEEFRSNDNNKENGVVCIENEIYQGL